MAKDTMAEMLGNDLEKRTEGRRKAAALLLALDSDTAARVLRNLSDMDMTILTEEMSRMGEVTGPEMESVLNEFKSAAGSDIISVAPMLEEILTKALGREKAGDLLKRIRQQTRDVEPFRCLSPLSAKQITSILKGEHPQVLAMVISHLRPEIAIDVMKLFDEEVRYQIVRRIATTEELPMDLMRQIDQMLEVRAFAMSRQSTDSAGERRFKTIAQILNFAEPTMSKTLIDRLSKDLPEPATQIQSLMFVFEDILKIDDKSIQKILQEIDKADLTLALKTAPKEIADKLMNNMSARARDNTAEELQNMGPKPISEVEEAQKRIMEVIRAMEEKGDVKINRGANEVMV